jgi:hypothetical protein
MSPNRIEQQWMDRLVDGELNESERLELLSRLDLEPGAWKRCAVTFLEAQMWQSSFRFASNKGNERSLMPGRAHAPRKLVPPVLYAAVAASLLTAFTLGWSLGGRQGASAFSNHMASNTGPATNALVPDSPSGNQASGIRPNESEGPGFAEKTASEKDLVLAKGASSADGSPTQAGRAKEGTGGKSGKEVAKSGLALPVVRAWERRGYQIEKEPQFVSVTTKDGRKLAVPVDAVRLRFIGDRIY